MVNPSQIHGHMVEHPNKSRDIGDEQIWLDIRGLMQDGPWRTWLNESP